MKIYKYFIMLAMGLSTPLLTSCDEFASQEDNPVTPTIDISDIEIKADGLSNGEVTVEVGTTLQLSAEIYPAEAANYEVTWTSGDPSVVEVSADGLITAAKVGEVEVKVASKADPSIGASVTIHVVAHIKSLAITGEGIADGKVALKVGSTLQLAAELTPAETDETGVTWSTSDAETVSVSTSGLITAVKPGKAEVKVTSTANSKVSATLKVTVEDDFIDISDTTVDPGSAQAR